MVRCEVVAWSRWVGSVGVMMGSVWTDKDTGLSVALFISVVRMPCTKSMVSFTIPWTCNEEFIPS